MSGETKIAKVIAKPAKRFFVSMLTRDIALRDAIMDLIDNCVDGVLRQLAGSEAIDKPYDGFWAKITATREGFSISDNCGGIPRDIAVRSAFRLGRTELDLDKDIPTVGMYGIGMKRALFKMGKHSSVSSQHSGRPYVVEITPSWLEDDDDWDLYLRDTDENLAQNGTTIRIQDLYANIQDQFDPLKSTFLGELKAEIRSFYALIVKKGFKITVNEEEIQPIALEILAPTDFHRSSIVPYAYVGTINQVHCELVVGLYQPLASEAELELEQQSPRKRDNAGWTIICNDRVVLHRDTSSVTGWGGNGVPRYHNQFIAIAGVVRFSSRQPLNLPLNTTKRGLDTSSPVYWHTLRFMQEGLKKFTDFTNHWKGRESETDTRFQEARLMSASEIVQVIPESAWRSLPDSGRRFIPDLPRPENTATRYRISFLKPRAEVEELGQQLFDNPKAAPAEIGIECFNQTLRKVREQEQ